MSRLSSKHWIKSQSRSRCPLCKCQWHRKVNPKSYSKSKLSSVKLLKHRSLPLWNKTSPSEHLSSSWVRRTLKCRRWNQKNQHSLTSTTWASHASWNSILAPALSLHRSKSARSQPSQTQTSNESPRNDPSSSWRSHPQSSRNGHRVRKT